MSLGLRKLPTRSGMTRAAVSTFIRSHQQALGAHTNEWTLLVFEPGISVVKLFHFLLELLVHGLSCVPSVYHEGCGGSRWLVGIIPTCKTCSRYNTSQSTGPNMLLTAYKQLSVGGTFWFLVPCMRKFHTRPAMTWTAVSTFVSIVTRVCCPSGYKPHQPSRTFPSFTMDRWYTYETVNKSLKKEAM